MEWLRAFGKKSGCKLVVFQFVKLVDVEVLVNGQVNEDLLVAVERIHRRLAVSEVGIVNKIQGAFYSTLNAGSVVSTITPRKTFSVLVALPLRGMAQGGVRDRGTETWTLRGRQGTRYCTDKMIIENAVMVQEIRSKAGENVAVRKLGPGWFNRPEVLVDEFRWAHTVGLLVKSTQCSRRIAPGCISSISAGPWCNETVWT
ncbi:hypothetical protein K438DRAFT_1749438 [Mycena galopus ATCC 62051]|nr:hypothetical protein K438DRAFT_1749438 [Mycena galopus ATCC 62051]